jgi:predicted PurR-regulated permease PerM
MKYIPYILCALVNVPFIKWDFSSGWFNAMAFGFCVGILVAAVTNDIIRGER